MALLSTHHEHMSEQFLRTAVTAAQAGGAIIQEQYGKETKVSYKEDQTVVTETDTRAESAILDVLKDAFPDHAFYSEEVGASERQSEYTWVIDPLDGTTNFSQELVFCCTSVALVQNGTVIAGAVYAPILDQLFAAAQGEGASLNGLTITAADTDDLQRSVVGFSSRTSNLERALSALTRVAEITRTYRILGSSALNLCYVASGHLNATIGTKINFYDGAAGALIAREAGALVTDFTGSDWNPPIAGRDDLVACSATIQRPILNALRTV